MVIEFIVYYVTSFWECNACSLAVFMSLAGRLLLAFISDKYVILCPCVNNNAMLLFSALDSNVKSCLCTLLLSKPLLMYNLTTEIVIIHNKRCVNYSVTLCAP